VFVVLEENHDWSSIKALPYISHLLQIGAHSERYYNPPHLHPSEPNYVWLESGDNHGLTNDNDPSSGHLVRGAPHLASLLNRRGISWTSYQEGIATGSCPIASISKTKFAAKHDPFDFFDDVVGDPPSATSPPCIAHHKPFTQFANDLRTGKVARFNFITPNLQDDMHDGTIAQGDRWLQTNIDPIVNPQNPNYNAAIYAHAALIITWDEGENGSDGPIGFIVVSPFAKQGYGDSTAGGAYYYTHSSTLLTLQEIFGVTDTPLGAAAKARDLRDLFTTFP
jgi:phosphatidylinositol-3-phosphatase